MRYNVLHFFERKNIDISNILYLTRQNPLTKITFFDGKEILTAIPVKEIAIYLPDEEFVNIRTFGDVVAVARANILCSVEIYDIEALDSLMGDSYEII